MMGIYNNYLHGAKTIGSTWAPKRQRLMVGRDVASMHKEAPKEQTNGIILANSVKLLEAARDAMGQAGERTRLGFSLKGDVASSLEIREGNNTIRQEQLLAKGDSESVYLMQNGGKASLRIVGSDGQERVVELKQGEDLRINWDKDGKAEILAGAEALTGGKLAAKNPNEVLIRMSGVGVEAGEGSTVLNFSREKGNFSGGHNVRYLGLYEKSVIEGGTGTTAFEGYFDSCQISSSKGSGDFSGVFNGSGAGSVIKTGTFDDVFSGYFAYAQVTVEGGKNTFSGSFMSGSALETGSGDDTFKGKFFDSRINDQGGKNTFGSYVDLKNGVKPDFVRTIIESGSGNDTFIGSAEESAISLGDGDDEVNGVLISSTLDAGSGNDKVRLFYASGSVIDAGRGDDDIHIITGSANNVRLGAGNDKMTSGMNADSVAAEYGTAGAFTTSAFLSENQAGVDPKFGHHFGDVQNTNVDASEGENFIAVHDGMNVHSVHSGERKAEAAAEVAPLEEMEIFGGEARVDMAMQNTLLDTMKRLLARSRNGGEGALSQDMISRFEKSVDGIEKAKDKRDRESSGEKGERFLVATLGGWLPEPGGNSVTILGGSGESVSLDLMARNNLKYEEHDNPLRASLRKYRQFSGMNSQ